MIVLLTPARRWFALACALCAATSMGCGANAADTAAKNKNGAAAASDKQAGKEASPASPKAALAAARKALESVKKNDIQTMLEMSAEKPTPEQLKELMPGGRGYEEFINSTDTLVVAARNWDGKWAGVREQKRMGIIIARKEEPVYRDDFRGRDSFPGESPDDFMDDHDRGREHDIPGDGFTDEAPLDEEPLPGEPSTTDPDFDEPAPEFPGDPLFSAACSAKENGDVVVETRTSLVCVTLVWENGRWKYDGAFLPEPELFERFGALYRANDASQPEAGIDDPQNPYGVLRAFAKAVREENLDAVQALCSREHLENIDDIRQATLSPDGEIEEIVPTDRERLMHLVAYNSEPYRELIEWDGRVLEARSNHMVRAAYGAAENDRVCAISMTFLDGEWKVADTDMPTRESFNDWGNVVEISE